MAPRTCWAGLPLSPSTTTNCDPAGESMTPAFPPTPGHTVSRFTLGPPTLLRQGRREVLLQKERAQDWDSQRSQSSPSRAAYPITTSSFSLRRMAWRANPSSLLLFLKCNSASLVTHDPNPWHEQLPPCTYVRCITHRLLICRW
jgi:hypothetical protein